MPRDGKALLIMKNSGLNMFAAERVRYKVNFYVIACTPYSMIHLFRFVFRSICLENYVRSVLVFIINCNDVGFCIKNIEIESGVDTPLILSFLSFVR